MLSPQYDFFFDQKVLRSIIHTYLRDFFLFVGTGRDGYPEHSNDNQPTATLPTTSCKKHVNDDNATFLANLKDRFTEFVNTRMDEHKTRLVSKTPWTRFFLRFLYLLRMMHLRS